MIIDLILNRREGAAYSPKAFYDGVMGYGPVGHGIAEAMDSGEESDVKRALKHYLIDNDYPYEILPFIDSVNWL